MRLKLADFLIQFKFIQKVVDKFMPSIMYEIGFTGYGPTALDVAPVEFVPNWYERFVWWIFEPVMKHYKTLETNRRRRIWLEITQDI
jgi:hypothetical protein